MTPHVSVVVPIFNKAPYLRECLESISAQTLADIEIICIDDTSTDGSFDVASAQASVDSRITVLRNEVNRGAGPTRNAGLAIARAPFVQFTDADDLLPPDALRCLFDLATIDNVPVVRGTVRSFDGRAALCATVGEVVEDRHRFLFTEEPRLWVPYFHCSYLFSKAFLATHRIRYPTLQNGEDPVFLATALTRAELISTTEIATYRYRRLPRPIPAYANVLDFLTHVRGVRDIYLNASLECCWFDGAAAFYLQDTQLLFRQAELSDRQREHVSQLAREIWPVLAR